MMITVIRRAPMATIFYRATLSMWPRNHELVLYDSWISSPCRDSPYTRCRTYVELVYYAYMYSPIIAAVTLILTWVLRRRPVAFISHKWLVHYMILNVGDKMLSLPYFSYPKHKYKYITIHQLTILAIGNYKLASNVCKLLPALQMLFSRTSAKCHRLIFERSPPCYGIPLCHVS